MAWIFLAGDAHAQSPEPGYDEREAQNIDRMIMCPVCPAETIDQAQVEISLQMRGVIRQMMAEGRTRQEILDFFVERYGPDILAAPPKSGVNLLAWVLPIVGVLAGLVGVYFVIRSMTNRSKSLEPALADGQSAGELAPYLELVDQHLGLNRASRVSEPIVEQPGEDPLGKPSDKDGTKLDG